MITLEEKDYILERAYIPEHSVELMTCVSGGEPFLMEGCFCCRRRDRFILVGYPLENPFTLETLEASIEKVKNRFRPRVLSLMAPALPEMSRPDCRERESDHYFTLDLPEKDIPNRLMKVVRRASHVLRVERSHEMLESHQGLSREFVERVAPSPRVRTLLERMPAYVAGSKRAVVLNAWDGQGNLAAFYVVDLAPKEFSSYVIGCHSRQTHVPGASDLLFCEMIEISREMGKSFIHLGLGVNQGIRRFKKKWGGEPTLSYEMCELALKGPSFLDAFRAMSRIK